IEADPRVIAEDPDFPGMEAARRSLPVVAGACGEVGAARRVLIAGHIDIVSAGGPGDRAGGPLGGGGARGRGHGSRPAADARGGGVRGGGEGEVELDGEAVLLTVPSEEDGGAGMLAAIRAGYTAEMAVITEPTRLEIVTAQAGAITFRLTITGRSAHAAYRRQ